jgi:beta-lactamase class D
MKLFNRGLFVLFLASILASCSTNNVHVRKEWSKYFKGNGLTGSFMLHNTGMNTFEVYDLGGTQQRYLPGATFDVMNALAGIETGVIPDTSLTLTDSLGKPVNGVDPNMTMGEAFRTENQPYFQEIARRIGRAKMKFWIDSVKYGNMTMGSSIDSFWLDNSLKISADEQMGLLEGLYTGKLPFQARTQKLVKALMARGKTMHYTLCYQTGTGRNGNGQTGWVIGWMQEGAHPHFFSLNMETKDTTKDLKKDCLVILNSILQEQGFFKEDE